jgi:uncharacterized protein (TIGR04255 family)
VAEKRPNLLPEYDRPPVIEVVCGVSFASLAQFKIVHVGVLWERFKEEFPNFDEQPPIATAVEQLELQSIQPAAFQIVTSPPLPRAWFLDEPGNAIIQVQRDAFLYNWRKLKPDDTYPRFRSVVASFKRHLQTFAAFLKEHQLGDLAPIQCELTYVNHISEGPVWSRGKSLGDLLPDFAWRTSPKRFLPTCEAVNWRTAFRLPERQGRLHISTQMGLIQPTGEPLLVLELKARGIRSSGSFDELWPWFDTAHEWIVRGFTDVTSEKAQKELWGRTK